MSEMVSLARKLAFAARQITLARFTHPSPVDDKGKDGSFDPVTDSDRTAERVMRELISDAFPDHTIRGEEFPDTPGPAEYTWSLDPIDGTRSYICGLPTWVTLIAMLDKGGPVLGIIDAPRLGELYLGTRDETLLETSEASQRIVTSACESLADARLSTTDPYLFGESASECFERLRAGVRTVRFGHDGYAYARLAAGSLDLVVECALKSHDYDALIPVVRGAGGHIGDWKGGIDFEAGQVIAAATPKLYEAAVSVMRDAA